MGTMTQHPPGTFCWINLSSTDPDAAKRFYTALLGWEYDVRTGDGGGFSMARRHGANVAAIYRQEEQERAQSLPPHWNNYVSVQDADEASARAVELGGSVFEGPFDVTDAGRTAILLDPGGAMFWVWQPRKHIGAGHIGDAGSLAWNELRTDDLDRAVAFYSSLFGWEVEATETGEGPGYWVVAGHGSTPRRHGRLRAPHPDSRPDRSARWIPYFTVESVPAATEAAGLTDGADAFGIARAGGRTTAWLTDPTGATFGVVEAGTSSSG